jgi:predicted RNA-binding Zn-ribbon protein involved in translation (DUF1610 family)
LTRRQVSRVCPNCGSPASWRARPRRLFLVGHERTCLDCGTRFATPTRLDFAVIGILLSTPILLLGVLSGVGVVFAMVEGNVAWLLTDVVLAVGLIWLGGSVMIQCVLGVLEVRTETAPRGFPVLPQTPDPPLPTGVATLDEHSGDASIEDSIKSGERAT